MRSLAVFCGSILSFVELVKLPSNFFCELIVVEISSHLYRRRRIIRDGVI